MAATTTNTNDFASDEPASLRVETFIACVETKRRRARRARIVAATVGVLVATVAFLTSIDAVNADAARLTASAGALVAGFFVGER